MSFPNHAPTPEQIAPYVEQGLVSRRERDGFAIFNYTKRCQYDGAWDDITRACRGLIWDLELGEIAALPWPKFFNHGEPHAPPTPDGDPVVTVKHDGSLGISYVDRDGWVRWTTRGAFDSPQDAEAQRLWDRDHDLRAGPYLRSYTLLVEIISPVTRVVVPYDFEGLVLLGVRNPKSGLDVPQDIVDTLAKDLGMRATERVDGSLEALAARAETMDPTEEGFVLRWGSTRLKVKSAGYKRVHRLVQLMSPRRRADLWYFDDRESLPLLPDHVKAVLLEAWDGLSEELVSTVEAINHAIDALHQHESDRKSYALAAKGHGDLFGCLMQRFSGREPDVRLLVYRRHFDGKPRPMEQGVT